MSKRNTMPDYDPVPSQRDGAPRPPKKKKKKLHKQILQKIIKKLLNLKLKNVA